MTAAGAALVGCLDGQPANKIFCSLRRETGGLVALTGIERVWCQFSTVQFGLSV